MTDQNDCVVDGYGDWYCPAGSIMPKKCPVGTYIDSDNGDTTQCLSCPSGKYCWPCPAGKYCFPDNQPTTGHNGIVQIDDGTGVYIDDSCNKDAGFVCREGNHSPEPMYSGYDLIQPNSKAFDEYSGPGIRGYIINDDATDLVACVAGEY